MLARAPEIARRTAAHVRAELPALRPYVDPVTLLAYSEGHVRAFVAATRERRPLAESPLDDVRAYAARRAREGVPLETALEAYRIGHRVLWEAIVEQAGTSTEGLRDALALTGRAMDHTDLVTRTLTQSYLDTRREAAATAERARRDFLDAALTGRVPSGEQAVAHARALGFDPETPFLVVVAHVRREGDGAGAGAGPGPVVAGPLPPGAFEGPFTVARHDETVHVRQAGRDDGAKAAKTVERALNGTVAGASAGISLPHTGLAAVPQAHREARVALAHAPEGAAVPLASVPLSAYLADRADDTARRLFPPGTAELIEEDQRQDGALVATLAAYLDSGFNVTATARCLIVHPNTVHHRLRRIKAVTGIGPPAFGDLVELLMAVRVASARRA